MDMLNGEQIAAAGLTDWRKLAQGLHARYKIIGFGAGTRFLTEVGEAGDALGHQPFVSMGPGFVDLKLVSDNASFRDDEGTEYVVEWVTQQDIDLARQITEIAASQQLDADPSAVSMLEIGLETADSTRVAPVWAALLTGDAAAQGRGTPGDEIRDATDRVPHLMFQDAEDTGVAGQRFHVEVYVPADVAAERVSAAVAAGGTIVDDSEAPGLTVIADPEGNRGVICADTSVAEEL